MRVTSVEGEPLPEGSLVTILSLEEDEISSSMNPPSKRARRQLGDEKIARRRLTRSPKQNLV